MKKLFLFATIAAAGLFASCSSTDDAISDAANNPIEDIDGDKQPIKISMGNLGDIVTRGTGTVGGVENDANIQNVWAGQEIKAFMFHKTKEVDNTTVTYTHTLEPVKVDGKDLYNNSVMITPGSDENLIPGMDAAVSSGEAMLKDGTINYYPVDGNFDFFGYHGDDAVAANAQITRWKQGATASEYVENTATVYDDDVKWTVPFTINGSQDLMSTKALLTREQADVLGTSGDYYSAKAARKGVQPTLVFNHLLTRLAFKVKADEYHPSAAGWGTTTSVITAAEYNALAPADQTGYVVITYTKIATWNTQTITPAQYTALPAEYKTWFKLNDLGTDYLMVGGFTTISKATFDAWTGDLAPLQAFYEPKAYAKESGEGLDATKAVRVKDIKIFSKTQGTMAVAWKEAADADAITEYEMGIISTATYDAITRAGKTTDWTLIAGSTNYGWSGGTVNGTKYATLEASEKAVATAVHGGTLADKDKIVFDDADQGSWLTLMARPFAKKKAAAAALALTDFTEYNTLVEAVPNDNTDPGYDAAVAAVTAKENELTPLLANTDLISQALYNRLTSDAGKGKNKYDELTGNLKLKEQLIAITPTAPTWDNTASAGEKSVPASIGEALIVAPKEVAADEYAYYTMKVTVVQKQRNSWNNTDEEDIEVPYELTIKSPLGGFKTNYSYNIILTVYSLERIEVIAEITPWIKDSDDIDYDPDAD